MPAPHTPFAFPPEGPRWTDVPADRLETAPYLQICEVVALAGDNVINRGTGWLSEPGIVATAAHVLYGADSCIVRWSGSQPSHRATSIELHPDYGPGRNSSEVDVAKVSDVPAPFVPLGRRSQPATLVKAVGFQHGVLVEHEGPAKIVAGYLAHDADTYAGHSGCPLLVGDRVIALHVGTAVATLRHLSASQRRQFDTLNSGILIRPPLTAFLYS